jgi:hypothetical protein
LIEELMPKDHHSPNWGGLRYGGGRPWSKKPRCACGLFTLTTARKRRHHCTREGPLPRRQKAAPPALTCAQRLKRIVASIHPAHLERLLQGIEIGLALRDEEPPAEPPPA